MKKIVSAIALAILIAGCTDEDGARRAVEAMGFKNVKTTGYSMFSCGRDDGYATGFEAVSADGTRRVTGTVCSGWFKGATVRFD